MTKYVLDSSALLAYIENEKGSEKIDNLLIEALDKKHELLISVISCIEIFYITCQEQNKTIAKDRLELLNDLPIIQHSISYHDVLTIGELKALYAMSFADCWFSKKTFSGTCT